MPGLHEKLPAPGCIHWVDISDVHVAQVHSADDVTQSCQQDTLTLKVEGSYARANDSQHRVQCSTITAGVVAGLNVDDCDWFRDSWNGGRCKGGVRDCHDTGHHCPGDCSSGCWDCRDSWDCKACLGLLSKSCNNKEKCVNAVSQKQCQVLLKLNINLASQELLCTRVTAALM